MPTIDPHGPPDDCDRYGRQLFFKLRKFLKAQGTWEDSDKYLLGQACRYEQRARDARNAMVDVNGSVVLSAQGYKGQDVPSVALKTAEVAEKAFVECLKELGLTPRARAQLGIEPRAVGGGKFGGAL